MQPDPAATVDPEAMGVEALLNASDEELAQLPDELRQQVMDIRDEAKQLREREEQDRQRRVQALGQMVIKTYDERVTLRSSIEQRWIADIRRYNGEYEPDVKQALESRIFGSRIFVPLARRVVNIVFARLIDLLFPTEERNFSIDPSPVPELIHAETLAKSLPAGEQLQVGGGQTMTAQAAAISIGEMLEESRNRARDMQREVDDQLRQANYGSAARDAIQEAMIIGTGVMKGPIVLNRQKKVWNVTNGVGQLQIIEDTSPTATWVSAWDFFPDMSARRMKDGESEIERHYLTKAQLAALAKQPGFDEDAIRRALASPPAHRRDAMRDQLRNSAGTSGVNDPRYLVMEYHGPVEADLLRDMGVEVPEDPLIVYEAVIYVLEDGTILKALIEPMDTQERPYSVFCWEKDPSCVFGFGLSHEVADMVDACNSSFRAAMDNLGLSVGPQLVVNSKLLRPHNGKWTVEPNKIWEAISKDVDVRTAFAFFQVDSRLNELLGVFDRSKQLIDDIGGPVMAMQGQEAPSYLDTARGASIAWNASNIWMRRAVRNWDDDITAPLIGRFVDWNMQYSKKQNIKGDHQVMARGVGALLEAEGQNAKMAMFMQQANGVPMPFAKRVAQLRRYATSLRLDPDELLPDEAQTKAMGQQIDQQGPPPNPEMERIKLRQAEIADRDKERNFQRELANFNAQLRMAEVASKEGLTREAAEAKYGVQMMAMERDLINAREERAHDAQKFNTEMTAKFQLGSGI